jgi:hypothetical protein
MIRRVVIFVAVLVGGVAVSGTSAHAASPAPTSVRAANGYIACVYEGYVTHLGLCVSMPI